jgi:glycosyltransferase involved in cell wall biosynthesis
VGSIELFELMDRLGWRGLGFRFAFAMQLAGYTASLAPRLLWLGADAFYSREITTLATLRLLRPGVRRHFFYEAHTFPGSRAGISLHRAVLPSIGGVVAITHGLADEYRKLGLPAEMICVAPDAADVARFNVCRQDEARRRLGWPASQQAVVYTGHFYAWKGLDTLAAAMRDSPAHLYLVGGIPEMIAELRLRLVGQDNLHVVGWVPPTQIPLYLAAADVLALPNSGREAISRQHTSPLKLFEYMAAARPIVASDLPSLREVLSDGVNALLVPADDAQALARGINRLLTEPALCRRLVQQARQDAEAYSWDKRAATVMNFIQNRLAAAGQRPASVVESTATGDR